MVKNQGQPQAQSEFDDAGDNGIENRVEQRELRNRVAHQVNVVSQADPVTCVSKPGIGRPEPYPQPQRIGQKKQKQYRGGQRSEEHTSELQSLMRTSYAVFCLKKKKTQQHTHI